MIRIFVSVFLLLAMAWGADAQSVPGRIPSNTVLGNIGTSEAVPVPVPFGVLNLGITHNQIPATTIGTAVNSFMTSGYATVGDAGSACIYVRGTNVGPGAIASADGAFWQLSLNNDGLSITCFGAKMDGATVDDAAVNAALAAIGAGGVIYVPEGRTVWNAVNVTVGNVQIKCSSLNATNIIAGSTTANVLTFSNVSNIIVRDCGFWSNRAFIDGTQQTAGAFLTLNSCGSCYIEHFEFNFGFNSAILTGSNNVFNFFDGGVSNGASNFHFLISGGSDHHFTHVATGQGPAPSQSVAGIAIVQSGGTWIEDSDLLKSGNSIYIVPNSGQSVLWTFMNNSALGDSCSGSGILIHATGGGLVYGGAVSNSWTASCQFGVTMIADGTGSQVGGWQFNNHRSYNNTADGFFLQQVAGGVLANIDIDGQTYGNSAPPTASGTFSGIHITGGASHITLRGRSGAGSQIGLPNSQKYNILIDAGASDYIDYSDMDLCLFATAAVSDGSTGQHNVVRDNKCWNPIGVTAPITVPASPATICAGSSRETHYYSQSATNTATVKLGSGAGPTVATLVAATTNTPAVVELGSNECVVVTWSTTAPTYSRSVH